jgi:hypothetical protein
MMPDVKKYAENFYGYLYRLEIFNMKPILDIQNYTENNHEKIQSIFVNQVKKYEIKTQLVCKETKSEI